LVTAAAALKRSGPPHGLSCRYGGEEFAIVLGGADLRQGVAAAEAVRTGFAAAQIAAADDSPLTASLGVALRQPGEGRQSLIGRADLALYAAKRAGRDRTFFHDGESVQPAGSL
jgi:diguanylate cyclase (GGDEF)-like protein